jgi:hypothetical protein
MQGKDALKNKNHLSEEIHIKRKGRISQKAIGYRR